MPETTHEQITPTWFSTFCNLDPGKHEDRGVDATCIHATYTEVPIEAPRDYNDHVEHLSAIHRTLSIKQPRHYLRLLKLLPALSRERLLQCTLELIDLRWSDEYQYRAISCTRRPSWSAEAILINGRKVQIHQDLWSCLNLFRLESAGGYMWVEQLCVDGTNTIERGHHAAKMDRIFRQASDVIVWLGDGDEEHSQAIPAIQKAVKTHAKVSATATTTLPELQETFRWCSHCVLCSEQQVVQLAAVRSLFAMPYWSELTSIQEVMLANNLSICIGSRRIDRKALRTFLALSVISGEHIRSLIQAGVAQHVSGLMQDWTWLTSRGASLQDILTMFAGFGICEDPCDRVWRLLGPVAPAERIEVDYGLASEEVFGRLLDRLVLNTASRPYGPRTEAILLILARQLGVPRRWQESTLDVPELRGQLAYLRAEGLDVRKWAPQQIVEISRRAFEREFGGRLKEWIAELNDLKSNHLPPRGPGHTERAVELLLRTL